jgi:hypothetical protein
MSPLPGQAPIQLIVVAGYRQTGPIEFTEAPVTDPPALQSPVCAVTLPDATASASAW